MRPKNGYVITFFFENGKNLGPSGTTLNGEKKEDGPTAEKTNL